MSRPPASHKGPDVTTGDDDRDDEPEFSWRFLDANLQIMIYTHTQAAASYDIMDEMDPSYVIMNDPDISLVRNIEVHQANRQSPLRVYFLVYGKIEHFR